MITCPTRVTCNTSTPTDHILTNTENNISQPGVIDALKSQYNILYHKSSKSKIQKTKAIDFLVTVKFTQNLRIFFANYENLDDIDTAYNDFMQKLIFIE